MVLEQLGPSLRTEASRTQFRQDFSRLEAVVQRLRTGRPGYAEQLFRPLHPPQPGPALEDAQLYVHQLHLSHILETASSVAEAQRLLHASALASSAWKLEQWEPHMLETAVSIAQKWKR